MRRDAGAALMRASGWMQTRGCTEGRDSRTKKGWRQGACAEGVRVLMGMDTLGLPRALLALGPAQGLPSARAAVPSGAQGRLLSAECQTHSTAPAAPGPGSLWGCLSQGTGSSHGAVLGTNHC